MSDNPSHFRGASNPVDNVSWEDAVEFCKRLSALSEEQAAGRVYRLPTEAEWEYACRGGSTSTYCFGGDKLRLGEYAWFEENSGKRTQAVGQKKPNAWGLYDMHGNVWEWCSDWDGKNPEGALTDPQGPRTGSFRVYRGGSWINHAAICRTAFRFTFNPTHRAGNLGFRLALSSPDIPKKAKAGTGKL
jgi:formylglycine-generating enzyme required for sulfatase activity